MAIALLFGVTACEQEIPVTKEEISQPQALTPVATEHTALLDATLTFGGMSRSSVFADLGFQKDESTGNYSVDMSKFAQHMSDDSSFEKFIDEGVDDLIYSNPDFEWFGEFLDSNVPVELEEAGIDFRGKKRYCCTVCCYPEDTGPSGYIAYKKSKRKRRFGARLWCSFRLILHSIMNQPDPCGRSLIEGHCIPNSCH